MTKRGGASYRRQVAMLLAPAIMLAFTFLVPLTAFAEPDDITEEPVVTPVFMHHNVYRERVKNIELRTAPDVGTDEVIFVVGDVRISAEKDEVASKEGLYASWHPVSNPDTGETMFAEVKGTLIEEKVTLYDMLKFTIEQTTETLVVRSSAGTAISGTKVEVNFNLSRAVAICADGCSQGTELKKFTLTDLSPGDYPVKLILADNFGEFFADEKIVTIPVPPSIPDNNPVDTGPSTITPVVSSPDIYIPKLDIVPIELLSTDFSIPVAANIISTTKRSSIFQATAPPLGSEVRGAATEEQETLEKVVDLTIEEPPATPLAPTSGGWSLFGVSWYWWAGSVATMWVAGMSLRLLLRKP